MRHDMFLHCKLAVLRATTISSSLSVERDVKGFGDGCLSVHTHLGQLAAHRVVVGT